ncbi:hypothetical protein C8J57DRAFT_1392476 [Mycena rebaudengoi]|nr:hypothetical protein C8J57DRAFT_1392476 [Mycena rebaudengoi]
MDPVLFSFSLLSSAGTVLSVLDRLPFEMWHLILRFYLVSCMGQHVVYVQQRRCVSQVCSLWRTVVHGSSEFWTNLHVNSSTSLPFLITSLLSVPSAFRSLKALQSFSDRLSLLSFTVYNLSIMRHLPYFFLGASMPQLRSLAISFDTRSVRRRVDDLLPTLHISGPLDTLTCLRLRRTRVSWTFVGGFRGLTVLVLRDMHQPLCPSWDDYRHIFTFAVALQKLSIVNVGCTGVPSTLSVFPECRELRCLNINFGSAISFSAVLASLRVSSPVYLRFCAHIDADILALAACTDLLGWVDTFVFSGSCHNPRMLEPVVRRLITVRSLDLLSLEGEILDAIWFVEVDAEDAFGGIQDSFVGICSRLEELAVKDLRPPAVLSFLKRRHAAVGCFKKVAFRSVFALGYAEEMDWFESHGITVTFGTHSEYPAWVMVD